MVKDVMRRYGISLLRELNGGLLRYSKKQGDLSVVTSIHTSSGPGSGGSGIVSILMSYLP
jgi:hypothetical protein